MTDAQLAQLKRKRDLHMVLPVFLVSVIACIDRVNIAYAKLTMEQDLPWLTPEIFGMGASIFFVGYLIFEVPGALVAARFSAAKWIARIMLTWGMVSASLAFIESETGFFVCRFLLGAAEASLYPVIYSVLFPAWFTERERARATSLMLTSLIISTIIGAPLAGTLLEIPLFGLHGWQVLFVLEAVPAVLFAFIFFFWVKDHPTQVSWLTDEEKTYLTNTIARELHTVQSARKYTVWQAMSDPKVLRLCLIYFLWVIGFWGFNFWMPTVLKSLSGWSTAFLGWAIAIPMAAALLVQVLVGMSSTLFVGAVGLGFSPFAESPAAALFLICLSAVGIYASMGVWWTIPTTFLSGPAAAGSIALINSCGNLGGWVGPYMMGWIKTNTGSFDLGYYLMGAFMCGAGLLVLTIRRGKD